MIKNFKKIKIVFLIIFVILLILLFYFFKSIIFQEGNPVPLMKGIIELNFSNQEFVKLNIDGNKYLSKSKNGNEFLINKLKDNGYKFIEQMGSGYFFINDNLDTLIINRKHYSRFYFVWNVSDSKNVREAIKWVDYNNEEYGFTFNYPCTSINNKWWGSLTEEKPLFNLLLPNQVLGKGNNFYLTQKYDVEVNKQTGELIKTENTFVPEYIKNNYSYPMPWHIVILDVEDEKDLDLIIKQKLGSGCSYKSKITTSFEGNYRVKIEGDGKDLGETLCSVNYANYIIYSPIAKKIAFWSLGQECNIGLGFTFNNCFDLKISDSFHFLN